MENNERYIIEDRETGCMIETAATLPEAKKIVAEFEADDKAEGIYEDDFYAIRDTRTDEIL